MSWSYEKKMSKPKFEMKKNTAINTGEIKGMPGAYFKNLYSRKLKKPKRKG